MDFETASFSPVHTPDTGAASTGDLLATFESFKQANDERLAEIEKRQSSDVLLEDKVDRINERLGQLDNRLHRPPIASSSHLPETELETRAAFAQYVIAGELQPTTEQKSTAVLSSTDAEGGVLIPKIIQADLEKRLADYAPFRSLAGYQQLENGNELSYIQPGSDFDTAWIGEKTKRSPTNTPSLKEVKIPLHEHYANPTATTNFLHDVGVDVDAWLVEALAQSFAVAENKAFIVGTGSSQPKGLIGETASANKADIGTKVFESKTGRTAGLPATAPSDFLIDFAFGLGSQYRQNAVWLMSASTQATIRKIKDKDDRYIWMPSMKQGERSMLLGHPVYEDPNVPDIANTAIPIIFGDFVQSYLIVGRPHTLMIRDPYSAKPFVSFYTSRRIGGRAVNLAGFRYVKISS